MERLQTTLLLIIKDNRILLARKKRGFGEGKINGIGGKMQPGETIDETMIRETIEEIGVVPKQYEKVGLITFDELLNGERVFNDMHIYVAGDFDGEIAESDEMCPEWYDLDKIPFDKMFDDDKLWYPLLLAGKKFKGQAVFGENYKIVSSHVEETDDLK